MIPRRRDHDYLWTRVFPTAARAGAYCDESLLDIHEMVSGVVGCVKQDGLRLPRSAVIKVTDMIPPVISCCDCPSEGGSLSI